MVPNNGLEKYSQYKIILFEINSVLWIWIWLLYLFWLTIRNILLSILCTDICKQRYNATFKDWITQPCHIDFFSFFLQPSLWCIFNHRWRWVQQACIKVPISFHLFYWKWFIFFIIFYQLLSWLEFDIN